MKPKTQRMTFIIIGLTLMIFALFFILDNFRDNIVFFYTPTDVVQKHLEVGKIVRIGGLVLGGSIVKNDDITSFILTDTNNTIKVQFKGILPPLFRDGQGVVVHGSLNKDALFIADNLLAKHDEKYMPPEVAEAIKKSGKWHPEEFK